MEVHFKELTGKALKETFLQNVDLKGKRLLNYINTVVVGPTGFDKQQIAKGRPEWMFRRH